MTEQEARTLAARMLYAGMLDGIIMASDILEHADSKADANEQLHNEIERLTRAVETGCFQWKEHFKSRSFHSAASG